MGKWVRVLSKLGDSYAVTLPPALVEGKNWKRGDEIEITEMDGHVELRKKK